MHTVYLSLGANIGDREVTLVRAIDLLIERVGEVRAQSSYYYSAPCGFASCHDFCNQVVCITTLQDPETVLHATQEIERLLGRTQKSIQGVYHDRSIDIDILLYDDASYQSDALIIPHPRMLERDFVMIPLSEIR